MIRYLSVAVGLFMLSSCSQQHSLNRAPSSTQSQEPACENCRQDTSLLEMAQQFVGALGTQEKKQDDKKGAPGSTNFLGSYEDVDFLVGRIVLPPTDPAAKAAWMLQRHPWYHGPVKDASTNKRKDDSVERRTPSALLDQVYLTADGKLNEAAVRKQIESIQLKDKQGFVTFCMEELKQGNADGKNVAVSRASCEGLYKARDTMKDEKVIKDWAKKRPALGLRVAQQKFENALEVSKSLAQTNLRDPKNTNSAQAHTLYGAIFEGEEIFAAAKNEDAEKSSFVQVVKDESGRLLNTWVLDKNRNSEASNLLRPGDTTGRDFLSLEEIEKLRAEGKDIGALEIPDSGLYRNPTKPISSFNVLNYDGHTEGYVGKDMNDPSKPLDIVFDELDGGGGVNPKFDALVGKDKYKIKFPLDVKAPETTGMLSEQIGRAFADGNEIYTENIVNPLFAAAGFTVDPTYFKKAARLYMLPKDLKKGGIRGIDSAEKIAAYNAQFDTIRESTRKGLIGNTDNGAAGNRSAFDYAKAFSDESVKTDERGLKYVEMERVSVEAKSDAQTGQKIGLFHKETNGRINIREHRCLAIGNALFSDDDTKDQNGDIKLIKNADGTYKAIRSPSDMGASFHGPLFGKGMPNLYESNMVDPAKQDPKKPNEVVTTFRTNHFKPIFESVTMADLRWCMSKFSQLSDQQIMDSMTKRTDMPEEVATLFKDKILRRMDQLNEVAGLMGKTIPENGTGRGLLIASRSAMRDPATYAPEKFKDLFQNGNLVALRDPSHPEAERWTRNGLGFIGRPLATSLQGMALNTAHRRLRYFGIDPKAMFGGIMAKPGEVDADGNPLPVKDPRVTLDLKCLPVRALIPNPNGEADAPYWLVDTFQFAVGVKDAKLDRAEPSSPSVTGKNDLSAYIVKEVIRIRPTKDPKALKTLPQLYAKTCNPKEAFQDLSQKMIDGMQQGDIMLMNDYKVAGMSAKLSTATGTFPGVAVGPIELTIAPVVGVGISGSKLKSVAVIKDDANNLTVAHKEESELSAQLSAEMKIPFLRLPVAGMSGTKTTTSDRTFGVDLTQLNAASEKDRKTLLDAMSSVDQSKKTLIGTPIEERDVKSKTRASFFSWFGVRSNHNVRTSTDSSYVNHETGEDRTVLTEQRGKITNAPLVGVESARQTISASLVEEKSTGDSDFALNIAVNYNKQFAHREDLEALEKNGLGMFPTETVPFKASEANYNLGGLRLRGTIQISQAGLLKALDPNISSEKACKAFEQSLPFPGNWCAMAAKYPHMTDASRDIHENYQGLNKGMVLAAVLSTKQFVGAYGEAQKRMQALQKASSESNRSEARKALSKLADMISTNFAPQAAVKALEKLNGLEGVCRQAELTNTVKGFPGQEEKVEFKDRGCSVVRAQLAVQSSGPQSVATDPIYDALQPYMFDYFQSQKLRAPSFFDGTPKK